MRFRFGSKDIDVPVVNTMCEASIERCRWGCGNQCAHDAPNTSDNETFAEVSRRYLSRRAFVTGAAAAAGLLTLKFSGLEGLAGTAAAAEDTAGQSTGTLLNFTPVPLDDKDRTMVAAGYTSRVLIRWGDPLLLDGQGFNFDTFTAAQQMVSCGYNHDYVGYLPVDDRFGVLVINNEYTNPEIMFRNYDPENPTKEQVDIELAAHGVTVVTIERHPTLGWRYRLGGFANRRLHGFTRMMLTGPAAGHAMLKTAEDPTGQFVHGTLNNCSAGITPWGTVLTCEENFNQYFANNNQVADAKVKAAHARYGLPGGASERKWERYYDRFDLAKTPNEAFKFGWVVEFDPMDPNWMPRKRTALGRFKHEATSTVLTKDGRIAIYMGDDERFDYMYRFVSSGKYNPNDARTNRDGDLLDKGILYAAKFKDDGTGQWLPLVFGQNGLTPENGFTDQGDVLIRARMAADKVGATKMDRPEDVEVNPVTGYIYAVMTNNSQRGAANRPGPDAANPRANNAHGHILELIPGGGDHGADTFTWGFLIRCGMNTDPGVYYGGQDVNIVSWLSSPDNITFDRKGRLWISTDGQINTFKKNDAVYAVALSGPERGLTKRFFNGVPGGETASLCFDDRDETLFVSIQHPGEGSTLTNPSSRFPDGNEPRPAVVFITKDGGGVIGS